MAPASRSPGSILARVVALFAALCALSAAAPVDAAPGDGRPYFPQTGYGVADPDFWDYFQKRGGVRTFGYPVSRAFTLQGTRVQLFQRRALQSLGPGRVAQLNLLDAAYMPYTRLGGLTVPGPDAELLKRAPAPGARGYDQALPAFLRAATRTTAAPGDPFQRAFAGTVAMAEAFPRGGGSAGLLAGIDLEMWGLPTSRPTPDPNNGNFVYQRFQRGVMHFDARTGTVQGTLLGDHFKAILTGANLPPDLAEDARDSVFRGRYDNGAPNGLRAGPAIASTDLKNAFEPEPPPAAPAPAARAAPAPAARPAPPAAVGPRSPGLRLGWQVHMFGQPHDRIVRAVKDSGFGWVKQQVRWATYNPNDLDAAVAAANGAGLSVLASVVTTPPSLRGGRGEDGPPDDYGQFASFVGGLAQRYRGRIQAYELWNEENFTREWGGQINACDYVRLLRQGYAAVKAADPDATVVSGALTPTGVVDGAVAIDDKLYLEQMYRCDGGDFRRVADAVGAHVAGYNNAPEDSPGQQSVQTPGFKSHMSFYFRRIDDLYTVMKANNDPRPMWITEYHWASASDPVPTGYEWTTHLSEQQASDFMVRSIESIRRDRPWVGAVFVWNLNFRTFQDYHKSETAIFGFLNEDWSPRALFNAVKSLVRPG